MLNLHIVWIPKYRRSILNGYQDEMKDILKSIAQKKQWEILAVEQFTLGAILFCGLRRRGLFRNH